MDDDLYTTLKKFVEVEASRIEELDKLFHLLEEMTEITDIFLIWIIKYCDEHKILIWNEDQLRSYIRVSRILLKEVGDLMESRQLPLKKFDERSPEDLPEYVVP